MRRKFLAPALVFIMCIGITMTAYASPQADQLQSQPQFTTNATAEELSIIKTLFSAEVLFYFIKLCYYKFQLDKICKEFQDIFFIRGLSNDNANVLLLNITMDYECLKSFCKIASSSKIFFKNNKEWSEEWTNLLKKIK